MRHASAPSPAIRLTRGEYCIFSLAYLMAVRNPNARNSDELVFNYKKGPMPRNIGAYLVELLGKNDIDTVFGIPGVHNLELYRGLTASNLRHVLVRHEQGAGFAADGFARLSGRPAAAFVISGPGLTNILTAAAQAYSDSVPLLSSPAPRSAPPSVSSGACCMSCTTRRRSPPEYSA